MITHDEGIHAPSMIFKCKAQQHDRLADSWFNHWISESTKLNSMTG